MIFLCLSVNDQGLSLLMILLFPLICVMILQTAVHNSHSLLLFVRMITFWPSISQSVSSLWKWISFFFNRRETRNVYVISWLQDNYLHVNEKGDAQAFFRLNYLKSTSKITKKRSNILQKIYMYSKYNVYTFCWVY
jgi:hypothetical protein